MDRGGAPSRSARATSVAATCLLLLSACGGSSTQDTSFSRSSRGGDGVRLTDKDSAERGKKKARGGGKRKAAEDRDKKEPRPAKRTEKRPAGSGSGSGGDRVTVVDVVDGDTIEVGRGGTVEDVRLIGVDTPETVHPTEPVECFGPKASSFTSSALLGESVRLEFDDERRDHYGRLLAYVWLEGKLFNKTLVARGFAEVSIYLPNDAYEDALYGAESTARAADRGMWSTCSGGSGGGGGGDAGAAPAPSPAKGGCDPNYSGACIPRFPPDIDCDQAGATNFRSTGSDPHGFDGDGDGVACEG